VLGPQSVCILCQVADRLEKAHLATEKGEKAHLATEKGKEALYGCMTSRDDDIFVVVVALCKSMV
jgi:hypothetical protein